MSTWHQQKNPTPLYHQTKWTAVFDPPDRTLCVSRFDTFDEAMAAIKGQAHSYVLPPANIHERKTSDPEVR